LRDIEHRIFVGYEIANLSTGRRAARAHTILATTDTDGRMLLRTPRAIWARLRGESQEMAGEAPQEPGEVPTGRCPSSGDKDPF
jgi:hypothetical protein